MTKPKFLTGNAIETNDAECKADAAATPVQTKVQTTSFPVGDGDDLSGTSEAADIADTADPAGAHDSTPKPEPAHSKPGGRWKRAVVYGVLPGLALLLALAAGYLNLQDTAVRDSQPARTQSVQAATDSTIALLSYRPDRFFMMGFLSRQEMRLGRSKNVLAERMGERQAGSKKAATIMVTA